MRAIYYQELTTDKMLIEIDDPKVVHHLLNVTRCRTGDEVLLLNGLGLTAKAVIKEIHRKSLLLDLFETRKFSRMQEVDFLIGLPKKNQVSDLISMAQQIGVHGLFFKETDYSQRKKSINLEKCRKMAIESCQQSNNPYLLKLEIIEQDWENFLSSYDSIIVLDLTNETKQNDQMKEVLKSVKRHLVIIGPEGGFSAQEREVFRQIEKSHPRMNTLCFHGPILKTGTALTYASGYLAALHRYLFKLETNL
jgi:16S rRNA (uracil1498-N3)-methyltransferase